MRFTLANKVSICIVGVLFLAVLSSAAALLSSWRIGGVMYRIVDENLPSVWAAEELEIALQEQRGFVSSYLLDDGNRHWLSELERRKGNFFEWLERAHQTAYTSEEQEILRQLEKVYQQYDADRDEVVALYDRGETEAAEELLVNEVNRLYDEAYQLCEKFLAANERHVKAAVAGARRQIRLTALAVACCVAMTVGLGLVLLWLFFYGVLFPLRAMVRNARGFAGEPSATKAELPTDEMREIGMYLQNLMSDVADTRTTLEQSQHRLRDAQKLASVGKLAASVAHEIRNPLTSLKMWLFSIRKDVGGDPELDHKFDIVSEEIKRLENVVRSFLEFSRSPELNLRAESIVSIFEKTLELVAPRAEDRGIEIVRRDAPGLPLVLVDKEQFRQVLLNLLNNAMEAIGDGGRIEVGAAVQRDPDGARMMAVRVSDTGRGMDEEARNRIFEPFFSTKESGTGLGLCIAARIVARHQGRLVLESTGEKGTVFAIYVPLASEESA